MAHCLQDLLLRTMRAVSGWLVAAVVIAASVGVAVGDMDNLVFGDDPRKPIDVDDTLLCHVCNAAVIETVEHVSGWWGGGSIHGEW